MVTCKSQKHLIRRVTKQILQNFGSTYLLPSNIRLPVATAFLTHSSLVINSNRKMSKVACLHGTSEDGPKIGNYVNGVGNVTALNGSTVLQPKKVVVVGKMTRYEFEKHRFTGYTEEQFKNSVINPFSLIIYYYFMNVSIQQ